MNVPPGSLALAFALLIPAEFKLLASHFFSLLVQFKLSSHVERGDSIEIQKRVLNNVTILMGGAQTITKRVNE